MHRLAFRDSGALLVLAEAMEFFSTNHVRRAEADSKRRGEDNTAGQHRRMMGARA